MRLPKKYISQTIEPELQRFWDEQRIYHFDISSDAPVYSIDTPPPTVSGNLHLGHTFSYSHPDFMARFWRMNGYSVFYPMGYDDNGLPTERLVENQLTVRATDIGRQAFIEKCLQVSEEAEIDYQALWQRLGLSIDWRYTYRTIDELSRRTSQLSFIKLYQDGLVYQKEAPTIWCPECRTAIAQADLEDLERESEFVTLKFPKSASPPIPDRRAGRGSEGNHEGIFIATTRPELLPACVAIFVNPIDNRYQNLIGAFAEVPIFGQIVPILTDPQADPQKGTGIVMCCTFGDQTDVIWWRTHNLPLVEAINSQGHLTDAAAEFAHLPIEEARRKIKQALAEAGYLVKSEPISQSIRVHERCDTAVEYIITRQWFMRILDFKDELLKIAEQVNWHPPHMKSRYQSWVEKLNWDWCISRQRYFGVPFPVWYCNDCGAPVLADEGQLPVDPLEDQPHQPCLGCGGTTLTPEEDVMDTWATSSLSPQIVGQWLENGNDALGDRLYDKVFPFSLRPQAHEIIRTWAFYTMTKSYFHFDSRPWSDVLISGWGIAGEGMGKISKSRGGGPMPPMEMIDCYSADAVRYWAASTGPGKDAIISEEKIQVGTKLVIKLWNVARFSSRFITPSTLAPPVPFRLTPADRWILSRTQRLIHRVTDLFRTYDYAAAKAETETFLWHFADNYLEISKQRLYDAEHPFHKGALFAFSHVFLVLIKLFAPILPHVTEQIYRGIFDDSHNISVHTSNWPIPDDALIDEQAEALGISILDIATSVRRYKSEHHLSLGTELTKVQLRTGSKKLGKELNSAIPDLISITRAREIDIVETFNPSWEYFTANDDIDVAVDR